MYYTIALLCIYATLKTQIIKSEGRLKLNKYKGVFGGPRIVHVCSLRLNQLSNSKWLIYEFQILELVCVCVCVCVCSSSSSSSSSVVLERTVCIRLHSHFKLTNWVSLLNSLSLLS